VFGDEVLIRLQCEETPWVMCRHKDAWYQPDLMEFYIGLIPVNMRRFNRHFIALPGDDKGGPATYNDYDTIVFKGQASLHRIIAESAKSMGQYVGGGFPIWSKSPRISHDHSADHSL